MRKILLSLAMLLSITGPAQLIESFADANFTTDPAWSGNTGEWTIVNSDVSTLTGALVTNTLRLNGVAAGGISYLSTHVAASWGIQQSWGFWMGRRGQAATTSNFTYVWLYASDLDVTSATIDGYRIRFGDNTGDDEIVLQKVVDGAATDIITSSGAVSNGLTDVGFLIRVTRSSAGEWSLFTSNLPAANATGAVATDEPNITNANILQGTVTDNTITNFDNGNIAFVAAYSTSTQARAGTEFDQLQFSFTVGASLPVKFQALEAIPFHNSVALKWSVGTEDNLSGYTVEKSTDGRNFSKIGFVGASGENNYSFVDTRPSATSYYRIQSMDVDGSYGYSTVAVVKAGKSMIVLKAFPSPVVTNLTVQHPTAKAGSIITIISEDGRLIKSIVPSAGTQQTHIDLSAAKAGFYLVRFTTGSGEVETLKVLKQ